MNTEKMSQEQKYLCIDQFEDRTIRVSEIIKMDGCEFLYLDCVNDETQIRVKMVLDNPSSVTLRFGIKSVSEEKVAEITSYINENMHVSGDGTARFDEFPEVIKALILVLGKVNL
ncbi:hypothetical protein [Ruminococcus sp.]|uniref:hypothetical protein n=1 Tax=Ruminococcus sp. TaxID=41978 RepID=UPI0025DB0185|nr:hypothetical protein [Ruminococcus sp.]